MGWRYEGYYFHYLNDLELLVFLKTTHEKYGWFSSLCPGNVDVTAITIFRIGTLGTVPCEIRLRCYSIFSPDLAKFQTYEGETAHFANECP